ncbi:aldehyde dehydrogenase family protein, partial [Planktotalea sp.]|uniref:aldehyde dehydrogenase family protein n=1 Tax=Planktotalea sp. TaxID=2029877 RepID=UPI003297647E
VPIRGIALAMNEPVGVIGTLCADDAPLLGLCHAMGAGMAMGNRSVLIASELYPFAATDLIQVLETSDVPAGVVNVITGSHAELAPHLAAHNDLDAVWSFSSADVSTVVESKSTGNLKRTWVNNGQSTNFAPRDFLSAASETKTVWVPYGE